MHEYAHPTVPLIDNRADHLKVSPNPAYGQRETMHEYAHPTVLLIDNCADHLKVSPNQAYGAAIALERDDSEKTTISCTWNGAYDIMQKNHMTASPISNNGVITAE